MVGSQAPLQSQHKPIFGRYSPVVPHFRHHKMLWLVKKDRYILTQWGGLGGNPAQAHWCGGPWFDFWGDRVLQISSDPDSRNFSWLLLTAEKKRPTWILRIFKFLPPNYPFPPRNQPTTPPISPTITDHLQKKKKKDFHNNKHSPRCTTPTKYQSIFFSPGISHPIKFIPKKTEAFFFSPFLYSRTLSLCRNAKRVVA